MKARTSLLRNLTRFDLVSSQIRALIAGEAQSATPRLARPVDGTHGCGLQETDGPERFAFTAIITEDGAVIVRVFADTSVAWHQKEYGHFETWTEAQDFAGALNQSYGIDAREALHIVVSANLAARCGRATG